MPASLLKNIDVNVIDRTFVIESMIGILTCHMETNAIDHLLSKPKSGRNPDNLQSGSCSARVTQAEHRHATCSGPVQTGCPCHAGDIECEAFLGFHKQQHHPD